MAFGYAIKPVIYGSLAARIAGVPRRFAMIEGLGYAFTPPDGREHLKRRALRGMVSILYATALRSPSRVFFLNGDDIDEFTRSHLVSPKKASLLGGIGVELEKWPPAPPVTRPVTFLLAARLLREKGIVEYATAARLVRSRHPEARFILLGGLDSNPGALSREEVESWSDDVEWPGHVPDVRPWLARASVFVLPSYYREGVPRSTQEAMSMARPVITTDAPGCRETVVDGVNGFLVPPRDPQALAEAMERFILHPELIERMGQASRRLAEERFDVRRANLRIMEEMGLL